MTVLYSRLAVKAISGMDVSTKQRIKTAIEKIPEGDIKPMQGYTDGRKRLRVGKYRVIFVIADEALSILEIGSRGDIYK